MLFLIKPIIMIINTIYAFLNNNSFRYVPSFIKVNKFKYYDSSNNI